VSNERVISSLIVVKVACTVSSFEFQKRHCNMAGHRITGWRALGVLTWATLLFNTEASIDAPGFGYEASTDVYN
jgi:hypothetical protein